MLVGVGQPVLGRSMASTPHAFQSFDAPSRNIQARKDQTWEGATNTAATYEVLSVPMRLMAHQQQAARVRIDVQDSSTMSTSDRANRASQDEGMAMLLEVRYDTQQNAAQATDEAQR